MGWYLFVLIYAEKRHGEWLNDFLNLVSASKNPNKQRLVKEASFSQKWVNQIEKHLDS